MSNGTRFAASDYWIAYYVTFLTDEQVVVASDYSSRILLYESVVAEHRGEAVRIARAPCEDGREVHGYYICPPSQ